MEEHADRLVGFVHSAGILRDALLMNQDAEKYDACVFKPKVEVRRPAEHRKPLETTSRRWRI